MSLKQRQSLGQKLEIENVEKDTTPIPGAVDIPTSAPAPAADIQPSTTAPEIEPAAQQ